MRGSLHRRRGGLRRDRRDVVSDLTWFQLSGRTGRRGSTGECKRHDHEHCRDGQDDRPPPCRLLRSPWWMRRGRARDKPGRVDGRRRRRGRPLHWRLCAPALSGRLLRARSALCPDVGRHLERPAHAATRSKRQSPLCHGDGTTQCTCRRFSGGVARWPTGPLQIGHWTFNARRLDRSFATRRPAPCCTKAIGCGRLRATPPKGTRLARNGPTLATPAPWHKRTGTSRGS